MPGLVVGNVTADVELFRVLKVHPRQLSVLGDVDDHRARPSAVSDIKGFFQHRGDLFGSRDLVVPLRNGDRAIDHVDLLESITSQEATWYLTGDRNDG